MQSLKEQLAGEHPVFGLWSVLPSSFVAELAAIEGYNFVCCDLQHGMATESDLVPILQAIRSGGSSPVVRVRSNLSGSIGWAYDAGADCVIVPMVESADEARNAVAACRYAPLGKRSFGPVRAGAIRGTRDPRTLEDVTCAIMIETARALEDLDAILGTPGIDVAYVGPSDLSVALGLDPNEQDDPRYVDALSSILEGCRRAGVIPGVQCRDGLSAQRHAELGFKMITVVADANIIKKGARDELALARGRSANVPGASDLSGV